MMNTEFCKHTFSYWKGWWRQSRFAGDCLGIGFFQVGHRIIQKRLHVRIEHVQPSRCREDFLERRKTNDRLKAEAKERGEKISTKRQPAGPKGGFVLDASTLQTVTPIPYDVVNDLKGGY
jgi:large subunit ribosomal protein L21e